MKQLSLETNRNNIARFLLNNDRCEHIDRITKETMLIKGFNIYDSDMNNTGAKYLVYDSQLTVEDKHNGFIDSWGKRADGLYKCVEYYYLNKDGYIEKRYDDTMDQTIVPIQYEKLIVSMTNDMYYHDEFEITPTGCIINFLDNEEINNSKAYQYDHFDTTLLESFNELYSNIKGK